VLLLIGQAKNTTTGPSTVSSVLKLVFGLLMLVLAFRQWQQRPSPGETASMPKWMTAIDELTLLKALGIGFLLSAVNPKNLLMCLGAGTTIGAAHLSTGGEVVTVLVFTLIAASTIGVPVTVYLSARDKVAAPLRSLRDWLARNNAVVMTMVLLLIGVVLVGKGIAGLST
jgi:threonine/homoserine/homoserine lactone efflux protein